MRLILALLLVLATTGWGSCQVRSTPPVPAMCDALCFVPVVDVVRWEGDPNDPATWDILGGEVLPAVRAEVATAELHRMACEQCLRRLHKAKVIDLGR